MNTPAPERLPDDAGLVDALAGKSDRDRPTAIDHVACRLLEYVTGIEQVPTFRTTGPLPASRLDAIDKLTLEHHDDDRGSLRSVTLSPQLAGAIAIQLADYAETLHHLRRRTH
jgi:hypothetical protein